MKTYITSTLAAIGVIAGLSTASAQAPNPNAQNAEPVNNGSIVVMAPYDVRPTETLPLNVGTTYSSQPIDMVFTVDKSGHAYNIDADTSNLPDRYTNVKTASLVTQLSQAIQGWKFEPGHDANGNAVERQVRLPITFNAEPAM